MTKLGTDLIRALEKTVAFKEGRGPVVPHTFPQPREVSRKMALTQEQMAPLLGLSLLDYRKIEQEGRAVQGAAGTLLLILDREPEALRRALDIAAEESRDPSLSESAGAPSWPHKARIEDPSTGNTGSLGSCCTLWS